MFISGCRCSLATCSTRRWGAWNHKRVSDAAINAVIQHFEEVTSAASRLFVCLCWCNAMMALRGSQHHPPPSASPHIMGRVFALISLKSQQRGYWISGIVLQMVWRARPEQDGFSPVVTLNCHFKGSWNENTLSLADIALLSQHVHGGSTHAQFYARSLLFCTVAPLPFFSHAWQSPAYCEGGCPKL